MFKKVLTIVAVAILTVGYAQAQFKFGARAGLNLTNMKISGGGMSVDFNMKPGFQIGVVGEFNVAESFFIQPGVLFAQQGFKSEGSFMGMDISDDDMKVTLNYIQIPINAMYKFDLGTAKLLLQAGPYFGYGISGKAKSGDDSGDLEFGNSEGDFAKALDFGLGIGAGVEFLNSFQVGIGYNFGLANLVPGDDSDDVKMKNNGLAITLTYLFGK